MPQIFQPSSNTVARASIFAVLALFTLGAWAWHEIYWSPYTTRQNIPIVQPVLFSHEHHVNVLGIDCRYCHSSVEKSAFAGIPETEICMTCHSQLFTEEPMLSLVRDSLARNEPLRWRRVNDLPDFVYFDHSIHIAKGIGCAECHGRMDTEPLTAVAHPFYMKWCLGCHRQPDRFIRPREAVFDMAWPHDNSNTVQGLKLVEQYHVMSAGKLTDCSICHR